MPAIKSKYNFSYSRHLAVVVFFLVAFFLGIHSALASELPKPAYYPTFKETAASTVQRSTLRNKELPYKENSFFFSVCYQHQAFVATLPLPPIAISPLLFLLRAPEFYLYFTSFISPKLLYKAWAEGISLLHRFFADSIQPNAP